MDDMDAFDSLKFEITDESLGGTRIKVSASAAADPTRSTE